MTIGGSIRSTGGLSSVDATELGLNFLQISRELVGIVGRVRA